MMRGAGPGERQAVEGAGAAADLVHQHQASVGGVVQDVRGLGHFQHERRAAAGEIVRGADAREDPVQGAQDTARFAGTKQPTCARITISAVWRM